jgi:hypothetical protein
MQMIHNWKIYHEIKKLLENLPCKKDIFGKFTMQKRYFWKIYHLTGIFPWKKILTENSHAYMDMPADNGQSGKSCPYLQRSRRSIG